MFQVSVAVLHRCAFNIQSSSILAVCKDVAPMYSADKYHASPDQGALWK